MICLLGVGLIETLRSDLKLQVLHNLIYEIGALICYEVEVADGVVALLIVDVDETCNLGESRSHMIEKCLGPLVIAAFIVVKLYEQHPLARVRVAQHEVAQQSVLAASIVESHSRVHGIIKYVVAHPVLEVVHEPALLYGVAFVEGSGDMESYCGLIESCTLGEAVELLGGVPPLVCTAELQFVAVLPLLHRSEDGMKLWQLNLSDARKLVVDLLLLGLELLGVGQILPLASAANTEV